MNSMKLIVKIMGLVSEQEKSREYNPNVFNTHCLGCPQSEIDGIAIKLQNAGYIEGLMTTEDIDNADDSVLWAYSRPTVTIKGIEYMETNNAFNKVKSNLKSAAQVVTNAAAKALLNRFLME